MVEIYERHRVSQEVTSHLLSVPRGSIDMWDRRHGGILGISQETLKYLIRHGRIPGASASIGEFDQGDLSMFPTLQLDAVVRNLLEPEGQVLLDTNPAEQRSRVKTYAGFLAEEHGLLTELGFTIGNKKATQAVRSLVYDDEIDFFIQHGKTPTEITAAVEKIEPRKGYLIAFSPDVANDPNYTFTTGDSREGDIRLKTGKKGLGYQYISAIEPLGDYETEFLTELLR